MSKCWLNYLHYNSIFTSSPFQAVPVCLSLHVWGITSLLSFLFFLFTHSFSRTRLILYPQALLPSSHDHVKLGVQKPPHPRGRGTVEERREGTPHTHSPLTFPKLLRIISVFWNSQTPATLFSPLPWSCLTLYPRALVPPWWAHKMFRRDPFRLSSDTCLFKAF